MLTLKDVKERMAAEWDELTILDMLGVDSYQLVEVFSDLIAENFDTLQSEFMQEVEEDGEPY